MPFPPILPSCRFRPALCVVCLLPGHPWRPCVIRYGFASHSLFSMEPVLALALSHRNPRFRISLFATLFTLLSISQRTPCSCPGFASLLSTSPRTLSMTSRTASPPLSLDPQPRMEPQGQQGPRCFFAAPTPCEKPTVAKRHSLSPLRAPANRMQDLDHKASHRGEPQNREVDHGYDVSEAGAGGS